MKLGLLLLALAAFQGRAQPNYAQKMQEYMQATVEHNRFNGNVLVAKNGNILFKKAFGYANFQTKTPLELNSVFDLASVSKQFTALSILMLKDQGKLSLSDSLRQFFPQLTYPSITIQQLLTHTSGLPDYFSLMQAQWDHKKVATNQDMIQVLTRHKPSLHFKPGTKWEYSNTGYAVLASIVEKVSGQNFAQFMAQYIFKPLGMNFSRVGNTRYSSKEVIPDFAYGVIYIDSLTSYRRPDQLPGFDAVYYLDGIKGPGFIHSTIGDLLIWDRALKNHTLLSEPMQRQMLSRQVLSDTLTKQYYGYGVSVGKRDNREYIEHGGSWAGFTSNLVRYVADDVTVIVLSNNASDAYAVSHALADILFDKPVVLPRKHVVISVAENILKSYAGAYQVDPQYSLVITNEQNRLMVQPVFQQNKLLAYEIFAESETQFFPKDSEFQFEFSRDAAGRVTKLILVEGGQKTEAKKIN